MLKSKLITALQKIEGDPDILLWNGFVEDWQDIDPDIQKCEFVKEQLSHLEDFYILQHCNEVKIFRDDLDDDTIAELKKKAAESHKNYIFDFPNIHVGDRFKEWYGEETKEVCLISPKTKNATYADRLGKMTY